MKSSLIILTYNELNTGTIPCIESIYKYTNINDFELIIVDNNSIDGTQDYLKQLKEKYNNVKIQLNEKNKGFAGGINDGLRLAEGSFLFILNNDILVTPDWLEKLTLLLNEHNEIGLIGPITNNAGNEQCVYFENINSNNYIELTQDYTEKNKNEFYNTNRLAFYCVGMRRDVFEKIGLLDENFIMGWFEDDDYCLRIINAGYKAIIAENCFIYHIGSLSFSKGSNAHAKQNELYFNKKHNTTWVSSDIALSFLEKIKFDIEKSNLIESDINVEKAYRRLKCFKDCLNAIKNEEEERKLYINSLTVQKKLKESLKTLEKNIRKKLRSNNA